jgi:hypothetical protein
MALVKKRRSAAFGGEIGRQAIGVVSDNPKT